MAIPLPHTNSRSSESRRSVGRLFHLPVLVLLFSFQLCRAQWYTAELSEARYNITTVTNGSLAFFAGGFNGNEHSSVVDIYRGSDGSWTTKNLSVARSSMGSAMWFGPGSNVFFAGGLSDAGPSSVVDIYSIDNDTWTTSSLSVAREQVTGFCLGGTCFFAGGYNSATGYSDVIDIYDGESGLWSTRNLSQARAGMVAEASGNGSKLFFAGGHTADGPSNVIDIFDVNAGTWTTTLLPRPRDAMGSSRVGNYIFFAGGQVDAAGTATDIVDAYNTVTGTWNVLTLSLARKHLAATIFASTTTSYVFAGGLDGDSLFDRVDIYQSGTWSQAALSQPRYKLAASYVVDATLFVGGLTSLEHEPPVPSSRVDVYKPSCLTLTFGVTLTPDHTVCMGQPTTMTATGAGPFQWSPAEGLSSTTEKTVVARPFATTTYTVTAPLAGCPEATGTATITVVTDCYTPGIVSFSPASGGPGTIVTIEGYGFDETPTSNHVTFNGILGAVTSATTTALTVVVPPTATTGKIQVERSALYAISNTDFVVCTPPVVSVTPPATNSCPGTGVTLVANGASTYSWSPPEGLSSTTGQTVLADPASSTEYTVRGFDDLGCYSDAVVQILVSCEPIGITSFSPEGGPAASVVTILGWGFSTIAAENIVKFNGVVATVNASSANVLEVVVPQSASTGTIGVTVGGNSETSEADFHVCVPPTVSVTPPVICLTGFGVTVTASGDALSYTWSPTTNNGLNTTSGPVVTANPAFELDYTVRGHGEWGCYTDVVVPARIDCPPYITELIPSFGLPGDVCIVQGGGFGQNTANIVVKFNGVTAGVGASSGVSMMVEVPQGATTGPVTVTVNGKTGTSPGVYTVGTEPCTPPGVEVSPSSATICPGDGVTLSASFATSYEWFPSTGLSATTGAEVFASPLETTTYTVRGYGNGSCYTDVDVTVSVSSAACPPTIITSFSPQMGPAGSTVTIEGTGFSAVPSENLVVIGGISAVVNTSSATSITAVVPPTASIGARVIAVTVDGFTATAEDNFQICSPPLVTASPPSVQTCPGSNIEVTASGALTYSWSKDGLYVTDGEYINASPSESTEYTVRGFDETGCYADVVIPVTVAPCYVSRLGRFSVDKIEGCEPLTVNIVTANLQTSGECTAGKPCLMSIVPGTGAQLQNTFQHTMWAGTYTLSVLYQGIGVDDITITVHPRPSVTLVPEGICAGRETIVTATGAPVFSWSTGETGSVVALSPANENDILVTGTSEQGCEGGRQLVVVACDPLSVTNKTDIISSEQIKPAVAITSGGLPPLEITFYHRKMASDDWQIEVVEEFGGAGEYTVPIEENWLDEIGMEYYFSVKDSYDKFDGTIDTRYRPVTATSVPNLRTGSSERDYTIFSIPLELEDRRVETTLRSVIDYYGGFDETKWRFVHYAHGENLNFSDGITTIDRGKGYWLLSVDPVSIDIEGAPPAVSHDSPFVMLLDQGWNQIGNPFPYNISWSDVLARNGNPIGVSQLAIHDPEFGGFRISDNLAGWGGGFVNADEATTLVIPVNTAPPDGGRTANQASKFSFDEQGWILPLAVSQNWGHNDMTGVGMRPDALPLKDQHDRISPPRFGRYVEMYASHPEHFQPKFLRDVVPPADNHTWEFVYESNHESDQVTIQWDQAGLAGVEFCLVMHDRASGALIDMKKQGSYSFRSGRKNLFNVYYAKDYNSILPVEEMVGIPVPNPIIDGATIRLMKPAQTGDVALSVVDMMGRTVRHLGSISTPGYSEHYWDATDDAGSRLSPGAYILRMQNSAGGSKQVRILVK